MVTNTDAESLILTSVCAWHTGVR